MFRWMWTASVQTRYFLRRYMLANIVLDAIRTRHGMGRSAHFPPRRSAFTRHLRTSHSSETVSRRRAAIRP